MEWKFVLAAVMLEHRFNGVAVQRATVSNSSVLASRRFLEDDEKVVRIKSCASRRDDPREPLAQAINPRGAARLQPYS